MKGYRPGYIFLVKMEQHPVRFERFLFPASIVVT
jgi:hypothetical protein